MTIASQPGKRLETATKVWRVGWGRKIESCSGYNAPTLFRNLQGLIACKERDALQTCDPLWSMVRSPLSAIRISSMGSSTRNLHQHKVYWMKTIEDNIWNWAMILLTGLMQMHLCSCPKPIYIMQVHWCMQWYFCVLSCFVDIGGNGDYHWLHIVFIIHLSVLYYINKKGSSWSWSYGSWIFQLPVQSVPITTKVVSSNSAHD